MIILRGARTGGWLWPLAFITALLGCQRGESPGGGAAGCAKDTDCRGERVCEKGVCLDRDARVSSASTGSAIASTPAPVPVLPQVGTADDCAGSPWKPTVAKGGTTELMVSYRDVGTHEDAVRAARFSGDGANLFTCGDEKMAEAWAGACPNRTARFTGIDATFCTLAPTPSGDGAAVASEVHGAAITWLLNGKGEKKEDARVDSAWIRAIAFAPDGTMAAGENKGDVLVWTKDRSVAPRRLSGAKQRTVAVAFSVDGKKLASGSADGTLRLWDVATGRLEREVARGKVIIFSVAFGRDGSVFLAEGGDAPAKNAVTRVNAATGTIEWSKSEHTEYVYALALSPDGRYIASGSADKEIHLRDAISGELLYRLAHGSRVNDVAFSRDGTLLVSASGDGRLRGVPGPDNSVRLWRLPRL